MAGTSICQSVRSFPLKRLFSCAFALKNRLLKRIDKKRYFVIKFFAEINVCCILIFENVSEAWRSVYAPGEARDAFARQQSEVRRG